MYQKCFVSAKVYRIIVMGRPRIHKKTEPPPDDLVVAVKEYVRNNRAFVWLTYGSGKRYHTTKARWVMDLPDRKFRVVHLNRDSTDCRKENLRIVPNESYGKRKAKDIEKYRFTKDSTINQDKGQTDWS